MVIKVKEPQPVEVEMLRPGQLLFTYLHLAPDPELTRGLCGSGATCIAYETVEDAAPAAAAAGADERDRRQDRHPGRRLHAREAARAAAASCSVACPASPPRNVMVIGGGVVGMNAALHGDRDGRRRLRLRQVDRPAARARHRLRRLAARPSTRPRCAIEEMLPRADLVIGAVLVPGARAPYVVRREQLALMKPGAVLVDVAIDQGGCFETSHADHPSTTRPSRSTGSPTTASPTCPARCRSPRPTR